MTLMITASRIEREQNLLKAPSLYSEFPLSSQFRFACAMNRNLFSILLLLIVFAHPPVKANAQAVSAAPNARKWRLSWSDEFNGANGSSVDSAKWTAEVGGNGWGNHELEFYTNRPENAHLQDGNLVIVARKEAYEGADGVSRKYTSARLKTAGKFSQKYGRFEARIKLPAGQGMWPAFWMLGDDIDQVGWPRCGEIDIMENIGKEPSINHGSIHGPGFTGDVGLEAHYELQNHQRFSDAFHLFAVEWEPDAIRFYVDDKLYVTRTRADLRPGWKWVFDHPFFILLNVAVGGDWPGDPDKATVFPQSMLVDYVRAYERADP
jgi:beta-glucanase (GH16 family)